MICDRRSRINSKTLTLLLLRNYYHFTITTTPLLWPLHYYDHSPILTTPLLRPLHHYHNCIIMTTPLLWPLAYYKHCAITLCLCYKCIQCTGDITALVVWLPRHPSSTLNIRLLNLVVISANLGIITPVRSRKISHVSSYNHTGSKLRTAFSEKHWRQCNPYIMA